jgi:hypothetical protein
VRLAWRGAPRRMWVGRRAVGDRLNGGSGAERVGAIVAESGIQPNLVLLLRSELTWDPGWRSDLRGNALVSGTLAIGARVPLSHSRPSVGSKSSGAHERASSSRACASS